MNLQAKLIRIMLIPSFLFHLALFWLFRGQLKLYKPTTSMKYFVSIIELPGGGGGGGGKVPAGKMRELVPVGKDVKKESALTYPVKKKARSRKKLSSVRKRVVVKSRRSASKGRNIKETGPDVERWGGGKGSVSFGIGSGPGGVGFGEGSGEFNFANFPFPYYLVTVRDKIALNWYRYTGGKDLGVEIVVYFKVGRQGQLLELKLEKSCGVSRIDNYALEAVEKSAPFPPLPRAYEGEYLAIRVIFE